MKVFFLSKEERQVPLSWWNRSRKKKQFLED
jgi:hypothetical protein